MLAGFVGNRLAGPAVDRIVDCYSACIGRRLTSLTSATEVRRTFAVARTLLPAIRCLMIRRSCLAVYHARSSLLPHHPQTSALKRAVDEVAVQGWGSS
jgi:hypothetical protein